MTPNTTEPPIAPSPQAATLAVTTAALRARLLSGSMIMLLSSIVVGVTNVFYNLVLARFLGAAAFGHASVIYTALMLVSSVTLAFQLVASKLIAKNHDLAAQVSVYRNLLRRSWQVALVIGGVIIVACPVITYYLNLPRQLYVVLLGIGSAVYIPVGVRRGLMQGIYDFRGLAVNLLLEVMVKLVGALLFLRAGFGVTGVIVAVVLSVALAYFAGRPKREYSAAGANIAPLSFFEGMQAIVFFVGQSAISNLDIILVKHWFPAAVAGFYAVVALVGRGVYMLCWSVVSGMFPVSAGSSHEPGRRKVLGTAVLLVVGVASLFTLAIWLAPDRLWVWMLGANFLSQAHASFSSLITLYALLTSVYSVSVVLMTYEMSHRIANTGWLQLVFSIAMGIGIYFFHQTLYWVVGVQLVLMLLFLMAVSVPFLLLPWKYAEEECADSTQALVKARFVSENEVIAEFLKAEFFHADFDAYRQNFAGIVYRADLQNDRDNELRRRLLFRRRGRMWRELPADIEWWEVELRAPDLTRIRVFPRKHWRMFAEGSYYLTDIAERIRMELQSDTNTSTPFLTKMQSVAADLRQHAVPDAVLLIGTDETSPLTIIEGNHRMTAAMLASPNTVHRRFRFYCGLSSRMTECCWYQTSLHSLLRYARNTLRYVFEDREPLIAMPEATNVVPADLPETAP